jgi:hypothetical protein
MACYSSLRRLMRLKADAREWKNDLDFSRRLQQKVLNRYRSTDANCLKETTYKRIVEGTCHGVSRRSVRLHGKRLDTKGWLHGSEVPKAAQPQNTLCRNQ